MYGTMLCDRWHATPMGK
ncbi:unnamed protein product [Fusarium graminearum]|nr:unnamed protein product [Fusarium graminearum]